MDFVILWKDMWVNSRNEGQHLLKDLIRVRIGAILNTRGRSRGPGKCQKVCCLQRDLLQGLQFRRHTSRLGFVVWYIIQF